MHQLATTSQSTALQGFYRAEDIIAQYGSLAAFMAAVAPKKPLPIPDLHFTAEKNRRLDEILTKESLPAIESEVREY